MNRSFISLFFSFIFIISIALPTIIHWTDGSADVVIENVNGEESEEKEVKTLEFDINQAEFISSSLFTDLKSKLNVYYTSNYASYSQELNSPPPEHTV